jgi:hypothetical protein
MPIIEINYLAVLLSSVIAMAVGAFWYSPAAFGNLWIKESGFTAADMEAAKKNGIGKAYVGTFVSLLLMSYVLAHVVDAFQAIDAAGGAQAGFWSWLGFVATVTVGSVFWEGKSWKLWTISNGHWLVILLVMGIINAAWR